MKSIDWSDANNYRNKCVAEIMELCLQLGLDSNATEKQLTIKLPTVDEINVWSDSKKRKVFNWDSLESNGVVEGMPDELEPPDYTLEEGEPPIDKDAEK